MTWKIAPGTSRPDPWGNTHIAPVRVGHNGTGGLRIDLAIDGPVPADLDAQVADLIDLGSVDDLPALQQYREVSAAWANAKLNLAGFNSEVADLTARLDCLQPHELDQAGDLEGALATKERVIVTAERVETRARQLHAEISKTARLAVERHFKAAQLRRVDELVAERQQLGNQFAKRQRT